MNLMPRRSAVLIVGAGPTGLTLAIRLRQMGVDCLVIDQLAEAMPWSRALGLHARTMEIFHGLGVLTDIRRRSTVQTGVMIHNDQGPLLSLDLTTLDAPFPWVLSCPQTEVEAALAQRFEELGGRIWRGVTLQSLTQQGDSVEAHLGVAGERHQLQCELLVGCDGAHSLVRDELGIGFDGVTEKDHFLIADLAIGWSLSATSSHGFLLPEGSLIALPMPDCWRLVINQSASEDTQGEVTLEPFRERLSAALGECPPLGEPRWLTRFTIHRRLASHYRKNRVLLSGDACHIQSPLGAQGMNTGIADAFNLAWKVALFLRGIGGGQLLDSYERERRPVARAMLYSVDILSRSSFARNLLLRTGRDWVLKFLNGHPKMASGLLRRISQLDIAYRDSPLVAQGPSGWLSGKDGPVPGERMPDAHLLGSDEVALVDLLQDPRHYLLIQLDAEPDPQQLLTAYALADRVPSEFSDWVSTIVISGPEPVESLRELADFDVSVLSDHNGEFAARYGGGAALWLMRPDGHLAYRATLSDGDQLLGWLRQLRRR
ncbi:FAD-dependent monooxygenase [Alcanivorax sp. 1008]|uniref:FAD-dependent monooxygenase n=1 Tax=Alcanivorax sp. 1008 TaxID=2816853 RepID=UPI001D58E3FF|nr:FAD-dependent monooxygenase [Alcanivorax sp. 1008]MCC1495459.1 FAD-dependent monooxygenase [Alcanivorax sp. 1008]